jgi:hypothetical protein
VALSVIVVSVKLLHGSSIARFRGLSERGAILVMIVGMEFLRYGSIAEFRHFQLRAWSSSDEHGTPEVWLDSPVFCNPRQHRALVGQLDIRVFVNFVPVELSRRGMIAEFRGLRERAALPVMVMSVELSQCSATVEFHDLCECEALPVMVVSVELSRCGLIEEFRNFCERAALEVWLHTAVVVIFEAFPVIVVGVELFQGGLTAAMSNGRERGGTRRQLRTCRPLEVARQKSA